MAVRSGAATKVRSRRSVEDQRMIHALVQKKLWWLPGAPLELSGQQGWLQLNPPKRHPAWSSLSKKQLAQAKFAVAQLGSFSDRELKASRCDRARLSRIDALLDHVAASGVEGFESLLYHFRGRWADAFVRTKGTCREHARLLDTLGFIHLTGPYEPRVTQLQWIQDNSTALSLCDVTDDSEHSSERTVTKLMLQLKFCMLAEDVDEHWMAFLLKALGTDGTFRSNFVAQSNSNIQLAKNLAKQSKHLSAKVPNPSEPSKFGPILLRHIDWLFQQTKQVRRRVSAALAQFVDSDWDQELLDILSRNSARAATLRKEINEVKHLGAVAYTIRKHHAGENLRAIIQGENHNDQWKENVEQLGRCVEILQKQSSDAELCNAISSFFQNLSYLRWNQRAKILTRWESASWRGLHEGQQIVWQALSKLFRRRGISDMFREHWSHFAKHEISLTSEVLCQLVRLRNDGYSLENAWALFESWAYGGKSGTCHPDLLGQVPAFARHAPSHEAAMETMAQFDRILGGCSLGADLEGDDVRATFELTDDPNTAARLLFRFSRNDYSSGCIRILQASNDATTKRMLTELVKNDREQEIQELSQLAKTLEALGATIPSREKAAQSCEWISEYPVCLEEPLSDLAEHCIEPRKVAQQILGKDFPTRQAILDEVTRFDLKLSDSSLSCDVRRRIQEKRSKVISRLNGTPQVSERRLNNLARKLKTRTEFEIRNRFEKECIQAIVQAIKEQTGVCEVPRRLLQPPYLRLLTAVGAESSRKTRGIGLRLLLSGEKDRKNQLPLAAENAEFVNTMERRGINMAPWITNQPEVVGAAREEQFRLGFATDPLDVLLMGFHFDTCLSPESSNFFSAITNAVDVNKQVLYCWRERDQKVLGRCLFTLTNDGKIQTFRRYSHGENPHFDQQVNTFATNLARAMKTSLTSKGRVKQLIADHWYDDGAVRGGLTPDRSHRSVYDVFQTCSAENFIEELIECLGSRESVLQSIEEVLWNRRNIDEPSLGKALCDEFGSEPCLANPHRLSLALIAFEIGDKEKAHKIFSLLKSRNLAEQLSRWHKQSVYANRESVLLEMLLEWDTQLARRYLIASRPRGCRHDEDEYSWERRKALSEVHRRLGRTALAQKLVSSSAN